MAAMPGTHVRIEYRDLYLAKPPMVRLYFDLWLTNEGPAPAWFLLPREADASQDAGICTVETLAVVRLEGPRGPLVGRLEGQPGFCAMRLAPQSAVVLRDYPVLTWGQAPDIVTIEAIALPKLLIWEMAAEGWFPTDPTWPRQIDVSAETLSEDLHVCTTRHAPQGASKRVILAGAHRTRARFSTSQTTGQTQQTAGKESTT